MISQTNWQYSSKFQSPWRQVCIDDVQMSKPRAIDVWDCEWHPATSSGYTGFSPLHPLNLKKLYPCATGWCLKLQGLSEMLLLLHAGPSQDLSLLVIMRVRKAASSFH